MGVNEQLLSSYLHIHTHTNTPYQTMTPNKFATLVYRNTNKIILILLYALLEWIMIILLLLNSFFSYLIIKFAKYFGLMIPCIWCSRLDHVFKSANNNNIQRDLLCETHSEEISKLGFCSNHKKMFEFADMCEYCLPSGPELQMKSKKITSFPRIKDFGISRGDSENGSSCADDQNLVIKNENQIISELNKGLDHRVVRVKLRDSKAESEKEKNNVKDQDHDESQESSLDTEVCKTKEEFLIKNVDQIPSQNAGDVQAMTEVASEEIAQIANGKTHEAGVSIGTDTSGLDVTDKSQNEKLITSHESHGEDSSTSSANFDKAYDHQSLVRVANEEYLIPDTPTSSENLHILHKKLLMLEQKESGIEESLDGNVESELEGGDGVITVERLKSALRAEQKALETLYSQLEEDQAMAIINHDAKEEEEFSSHDKTPVDEFVNMEDSLEEERSSILLQLKFLEEKLASLKEEEPWFEDVTMVEDIRDQNEIHVDGNACSSDESNEHLLQEILHHLHDLREMELQVQEN